MILFNKYYHSVFADQTEQKCLIRILWRPLHVWGKSFTQIPPDVYRFKRITFGYRPSGCASAVSLHDTVSMFGGDKPEATKAIKEESYVDDILTGENTKKEAREKIKDIEAICKPGGFTFKQWTVSDQLSDDEEVTELFNSEEQKVLGFQWMSKEDILVYKSKINPYKRQRGKKVGPDIENIEDLPKEIITKRNMLRIVNSLFYPLGLILIFTIQLKINLKKANGSVG